MPDCNLAIENRFSKRRFCVNAMTTPGGVGPYRLEIAGPELGFRPVHVSDPQLTGAQILRYADATPQENFVVLQWLTNGDIDELRPDETADLATDDAARFIVAKADRLFRFVLNDRSLVWPERKIDAAIVRILGGVDAGESLFIRREEVADEPVPDGGRVALAEAGVEVIYSRKNLWKINVQNVVVEVATPIITVRAALQAANFDPDQGWIVVLKTSEGKRQVELDDPIDLRLPGIEKLRLTPREINNGEAASPSGGFSLLEVDARGLDLLNHRWSTLVDNGRRWLLLHDVPLPPGYVVTQTTLAIEMPTAYPMAELDMFYCRPALERCDGKPIPQTQVTEHIQGEAYQRWSRHRGGSSPWRPGADNVITHLALIEASLLREVEP